jgi:hypothetical protein
MTLKCVLLPLFPELRSAILGFQDMSSQSIIIGRKAPSILKSVYRNFAELESRKGTREQQTPR